MGDITTNSGGTNTSTPSANIDVGGITLPPQPLPSYETLSSTANANSTLAGSAIRSHGTSGALDLVRTTGTLQHNTGATTLNDGTFTLTDSNGFSNGILTDGSATLTSNGTQGFSGTYEYVRPYNQTYVSGGVTFDSTGAYGIVTKTTDMPTSGSGTYTGEATGTVVTEGGAQGFNLRSGTSTVNADFAARYCECHDEWLYRDGSING